MASSDDNKDLNTHLDNLWSKTKEKLVTIWKGDKEMTGTVPPTGSITPPLSKEALIQHNAKVNKETFIDDAAKHIMGCLHSTTAMGQDVVNAAKHSYQAAEALWTEKMKRQK